MTALLPTPRRPVLVWRPMRSPGVAERTGQRAGSLPPTLRSRGLRAVRGRGEWAAGGVGWPRAWAAPPAHE